MEEEKAAALYDELTRKGEGAARFKQGLGFSSTSNNNAFPSHRSSALPTFSSSSSFLNTFVKASNPSKTDELDKQAQFESIQNKLKKKQPHQHQNPTRTTSTSGVSTDVDTDTSRHSSRRSREWDKHSNPRIRSRSRSSDRDRQHLRRHRHRSGGRDDDDSRRRGYRSRSSSKERGREGCRRRRRRRSESPPSQREEREKNRTGSASGGSVNYAKERRNSSRINYAELIEGYEKMTAAEKVKAKMKLQLSETAEKDETKGIGSGWERFDFDKDAPLDDQDIEAVEDDGALVKHIGQSFRFATLEARREEKIKAAHDEAMFGAASLPPATATEDEEEEEEEPYDVEEKTHENVMVGNLLSDKVLTMQQGSWRDRVRKL